MTSRRLLIVEDHVPTRAVLRGLFKRRGWDVEEVGTVADGMAHLEPPPNFIILDLDLPDGGGEAILERVRRDDMPTQVAVCSGSSEYARWMSVARLNPDAQLMKPVQTEALYDLSEMMSFR